MMPVFKLMYTNIYNAHNACYGRQPQFQLENEIKYF